MLPRPVRGDVLVQAIVQTVLVLVPRALKLRRIIIPSELVDVSISNTVLA
jgi:hypothetical protein